MASSLPLTLYLSGRQVPFLTARSVPAAVLALRPRAPHINPKYLPHETCRLSSECGFLWPLHRPMTQPPRHMTRDCSVTHTPLPLESFRTDEGDRSGTDVARLAQTSGLTGGATPHFYAVHFLEEPHRVPAASTLTFPCKGLKEELPVLEEVCECTSSHAHTSHTRRNTSQTTAVSEGSCR